ncbi:type II secretion system F family protein [Paenibacillus spongiae]|uniref:Type II secretion system F family protein n=1 Tax=Paenibacillus spongiae TaxID=2909671 RepID=A0ABY5SFD0_9BACL|nr:type II secretion system F family protein [Paenibacillus spongiae]UVI31420.1 type II secretion system F family protein [Paenibacillus spongiae]
MAIIAGLLLTAVWGAAVFLSARQETGSGSKGVTFPKDAQEIRFITLPFRFLLDRYGLFDRFQSFLTNVHGKLLVLHGSAWSIEATRRYASSAVGFGYAAMAGACWLSALSSEPALLYVGALLGAAIPMARLRDVSRKVERRKQEILLLLPDVLSKLMLLLGAGETVQRALSRCVERQGAGAKASHPLLDELRRANESVRNGESFAAAMEGFSRRCAVQEVSLFTTTMLLNYRRGGDKLVLSLRELTYTLWEKRKAVARSRGEEASSKLVFPLVGIFIVLMILVASPAMLMMGW